MREPIVDHIPRPNRTILLTTPERLNYLSNCAETSFWEKTHAIWANRGT
jgi:hypothetical protein